MTQSRHRGISRQKLVERHNVYELCMRRANPGTSAGSSPEKAGISPVKLIGKLLDGRLLPNSKPNGDCQETFTQELPGAIVGM